MPNEPCIHGHVTDDAGQRPCVNCLRAKLSTRDLRVRNLEQREARLREAVYHSIAVLTGVSARPKNKTFAARIIREVDLLRAALKDPGSENG